jgi:hypothetical protein
VLHVDGVPAGRRNKEERDGAVPDLVRRRRDDEMFAQGWREWAEYRGARRFPPRSRPAARVRAWVLSYCDFFLAQPVRFQLLNQRVVPGFEPSAGSYAGAIADWEAAREEVRALGVQDPVSAVRSVWSTSTPYAAARRTSGGRRSSSVTTEIGSGRR